MYKFFFFIFIVCFLPFFCFASEWHDDFESYNSGKLDGQDDWTSEGSPSSTVLVSDDCYYSTQCASSTGQTVKIKHLESWSSSTEGTLTFQAKLSSTTALVYDLKVYLGSASSCLIQAGIDITDTTWNKITVSWSAANYYTCVDSTCTSPVGFDVDCGNHNIDYIDSVFQEVGSSVVLLADNFSFFDDGDTEYNFGYGSGSGIHELILNQIDCENEGWYWVETPVSSGGYLIAGLVDYECVETATGTCNSTSSGFTTGCQFCSQTDCNATGTHCYWNTDTSMCNAFAHSCGEYTLTQFCTNETDCLTIGHGYWYNSSCHYAQLDEEEASTTSPLVALFEDIPIVNKLLPLFLNPQSWIKNQINALNPMNKPPFSWIVQIITDINDEIDEFEDGTYTADATLMADDFGTIEITFLNATTDISLINFKYVRDNYSNSFDTFKTIVSYICWLEFAMFLFYTTRNWINKHSTKS